MKLPAITTTTAGQLQAPETPSQAVVAPLGQTSMARESMAAASEAYKGITTVAYTRAEAKAKKEYAQRWSEFTNRSFVSTDELDAMGVEYDPNLANPQTTVGPDGAPVEQRAVPVWAVAEAAHKRLVGDVIERNKPTATNAAASRFVQDFDLTYGTEAQARVGEWATNKRIEFQRAELNDSIQDFLEIGDYGAAEQALNRSFAAGILDENAYRDGFSHVQEIKERDDYVDVIENGTLKEKERLLTELLEGIKTDSRTYNGELLVEERRPYINQLQVAIKAIREGSSDKSMAARYIKEAEGALARGEQFSPELQMQGWQVVGAFGNQGQQYDYQQTLNAMSYQQSIFTMPEASLTAELNALKAKAEKSGKLEDVTRHRQAVASADLKRKQIEADPARFVLEYGPSTPAKKAALAAGPFEPIRLLEEGGASLQGLLNDRRVMMNEGAGIYGADKLLLTKDELNGLRQAWQSQDIAGRLALATELTATGIDNAQAIFDQLSVDGTVEGYAIPAAGAALLAGAPDAAAAIISSSAMASDPRVKAFANNAQLRDKIRAEFPPGMELTMSPRGLANFNQAATNLYAYQADIAGLDPKLPPDPTLVKQVVQLMSGGTLTTYGNTRVRPPAGITAADMDYMLRRADGQFWQSKLDAGGYTFDRERNAYITGEGLKQQLATGNAWLAPAFDGADSYKLMYLRKHQQYPNIIEPAIYTDADGDEVTFTFTPEDATRSPMKAPPLEPEAEAYLIERGLQ